MSEMTLEEWFAEYERLAKEQGILWVSSGDARDYEHPHSDGMTPEDCLSEDLDACRDSV